MQTNVSKAPYICRADELVEIAKLVTLPKVEARNSVYYLTGPSGCGKTAAVLPLFLKLVELKHVKAYLYMPFHNNLEQHHGTLALHLGKGALGKWENLGSWWMLHAVRFALDGKYIDDLEMSEAAQTKVQRNNNSADLGEKLTVCLRKVVGEDGKILIHVDEHRHLCLPFDGDNEDALRAKAAFRKGAVGLLAKCKQVLVVASFIEPPLEVPPIISSSLCRSPLPIPSLCAHALLEKTGIAGVKVSGMKKRHRITLVALAVMWYTTSPSSLHVPPEEDAFQRDLNELKHDLRLEKLNHTIRQLWSACSSRLKGGSVVTPKLLAGLKDEDLQSRKFPLMQVIMSEARLDSPRLCLPLGRLIHGVVDKASPQWFSRMRGIFAESFQVSKDAIPHADTTLEYLYAWVLASISSQEAELCIGGFSFEFCCEQVCPGRICDWNMSQARAELQKREVWNTREKTLYYTAPTQDDACAENYDNRPLFNLWFWSKKSGKDILVLIDVTGIEQVHVLREKSRKLTEFTLRTGPLLQRWFSTECSCYAYIMAPNCDTGEETLDCVISRQSALGLLRGCQKLAAPYGLQ
eukprot:96914-Amphidinium_carterae.1